MNKPKAIVFDCWNTLFYVRSHPTVFTRIAQLGLRSRLSYPLIKKIERSLQLAPEPSPEAAAAKLARDLGLPPVKPLTRRLTRIITSASRHHEAYHDSLEVVEHFRTGYRLGLLSNTYQTSFESLRGQFRLDERFDVVMPSYEVGMIKPDPRLFHLMLDRLGVAPHEAVMVGDNLRDDIHAAQAVGMTGILVDRRNRYPKASPRITSLSELGEWW